MPTVVQLPAGKVLTVRAAADAFLDSLRNPNTVRSYSTGDGKTAKRIGEGRPRSAKLWNCCEHPCPAVNTWNARRAEVLLVFPTSHDSACRRLREAPPRPDLDVEWRR
ncbi:hypothetical protein YUWDRAFT_07011 [Streptomyces sp. AmelKG-D3]|nr:hypothetical protein YUWDRAFT_07011 [Streptomyces sp. AmelKG-D3]